MNPATMLGSADGAASELYEEYSPAEEQVGEQLASDDEEIDPSDVRNFPISEQTMDVLAARGITKLFPVQSATFNEIYNGRDVLARARTGTGKTLGFALPIMERLLLDKEAQAAAGTGRRRGGQKPACVILSPTRELAQQVRRRQAESLRGGRNAS
jgi:ATP-dependent RNA helicase DDX21